MHVGMGFANLGLKGCKIEASPIAAAKPSGACGNPTVGGGVANPGNSTERLG